MNCERLCKGARTVEIPVAQRPLVLSVLHRVSRDVAVIQS